MGCWMKKYRSVKVKYFIEELDYVCASLFIVSFCACFARNELERQDYKSMKEKRSFYYIAEKVFKKVKYHWIRKR